MEKRNQWAFDSCRARKVLHAITSEHRRSLRDYREALCDFVMIGDISITEAVWCLGMISDKMLDGDPVVY